MLPGLVEGNNILQVYQDAEYSLVFLTLTIPAEAHSQLFLVLIKQ